MKICTSRKCFICDKNGRDFKFTSSKCPCLYIYVLRARENKGSNPDEIDIFFLNMQSLKINRRGRKRGEGFNPFVCVFTFAIIIECMFTCACVFYIQSFQYD